MAEEIVDIVDEDGRVLRQAAKREAHKHGWLHKTVIGYLRQGQDWALVRQTADRQDAGQLVAPVGGHVRAGETEAEALLREAEEEIGTRNITHALVGRTRFHRQVLGRDENHLFIIYEIATDDEIVLGEEAEAIELFTTQGLKHALQATPQNFGDAYYFILEQFYPITYRQVTAIAGSSHEESHRLHWRFSRRNDFQRQGGAIFIQAQPKLQK